MKKIIFIIYFMIVLFTASCGKNENNDNIDVKVWFENDGNYTYNTCISDTSSVNWNPLTREMYYGNKEFEYLSMGFYDYQLNSTYDNWEIIPEMAKSLPIDVTSEYVGKYGIKIGDKAKAWSITLNENAKWENGVNITAKDYIYSMKQLLDPMQCYRGAEFYCSGNFAVYNARNYLNSLQDGVYETPATLGFDSVQEAIDKGLIVYIDIESFLNLNAKDAETEIIDATKDGALVPVTSTIKIRNNKVTKCEDEDWISAFDIWQKYQDDLEVGGNNHSCMQIYVPNEYKNLEFSDVGLFAKDDYTLIIVLENELLNPSFYLPYYLSRNWLINEELYEACWIKNFDGQRSNIYMTSKSTTISYGPYILSEYDNDKQIVFRRNVEWYGYYDDKHNNQFQTDTICYKVIKEHENTILAYENGEIDTIQLEFQDIKTYGDSQYLLYTPHSQNTQLSINTKLDALIDRESNGINKRILTVKQFREALSLCINRTYFTMNFTTASGPSYSLFNQVYQILNENGVENSYRNYEAAKQAIVNLYGIKYGQGTKYRDLNSAYRAITGYDIKKARNLMQEAYDYAVQNNLYCDDEIIKIRLSVSKSDPVNLEMYEYIKSQLNKAVTGTSLEGKIELEIFFDDNYYNSFYLGETDIIFNSSGYNEYDIFDIMSQVYCSDNQLENIFDTNKISVTITLRDNQYTYSLKEWADWLNGTQTIVKLGHNSNWTITERVNVLAACEKAYLAEYCEIPIYYCQTVSLYSSKINYGANMNISLIEFGGVRHMTYNFTDEAWETVKQQG